MAFGMDAYSFRRRSRRGWETQTIGFNPPAHIGFPARTRKLDFSRMVGKKPVSHNSSRAKRNPSRQWASALQLPNRTTVFANGLMPPGLACFEHRGKARIHTLRSIFRIRRPPLLILTLRRDGGHHRAFFLGQGVAIILGSNRVAFWTATESRFAAERQWENHSSQQT